MGKEAGAREKRRGRANSSNLMVAAALLIAPVLFVPRWWCGRKADGFFEGRLGSQEPLAREVARWVEAGVGKSDFNTGATLFDAEWQFGTYQMAALGLTQVMRRHPETRERFMPVVETCLERLLSRELRAFDANAWGEDALESLDGAHGHAAYLGYMNVALGLYRLTADEPKFTDVHTQVTEALARRFQESRTGTIETYPGQSFPVDNAAGIASLALYDRATGADHGAVIQSWLRTCRERHIDPKSGLLYQRVDSDTGEPVDHPRASGTALASYFLSFADTDFSRRMTEDLTRSCGARWLGFGLVREYPPGVPAGRGDIDSGPVIFGMSFSGTGFHIAGCRIVGDRDTFRAIYRTAHLIGSPVRLGDSRTFACGGPLGNAIMLAMLTAGEDR